VRAVADKTIVTCALTGAQQGKDKSPHLPEQPDEIIAQGLDAWRAGAAILHLHARDACGRTTADLEVFRRIVHGLRAAGCDALLNLTTGGAVAGLPLEERLAVVAALAPEIATFSVGGGSLLGRYDEGSGRWTGDRFVPLFSSHAELERVTRLFREHDVRPELEVYHAGMLNNLRTLRDRGLLAEPLLVNFVMGIPGEVSEASVKNLVFLTSELPADAHWLVTAIGARNHYRMLGAVLAMGGHVRVGLEDCVHIARGQLAPGNGAVVEKAARIIRELGAEPASPDEARAMLGIKKTGRRGHDHAA
jgi:uncharacterized protein (DUF849 family)